MSEQSRVQQTSRISRRELLVGAAGAALSLMTGASLNKARGQGAGQPNSKFNGVQIGAITYSFRSLPEKFTSRTPKTLGRG